MKQVKQVLTYQQVLNFFKDEIAKNTKEEFFDSVTGLAGIAELLCDYLDKHPEII